MEKKKHTIMSSTGIGTGSFSLYLLFTSLAMMRTMMDTTLTSRVGRWVLGSCTHTSTSVCIHKEQGLMDSQKKKKKTMTRSVSLLYVATKGVNVWVLTYNSENGPLNRVADTPKMCFNWVTTAWVAAAVVYALTNGSERYIPTNPNCTKPRITWKIKKMSFHCNSETIQHHMSVNMHV